MKHHHKGFTLVEIMIVVGIIGLILAITIPNYIRSRELAQVNACISNLKKIDSFKTNWALDNKKNGGDSCTMGDLVPQYIKVEPKCPAGSQSYQVMQINASPTCPNFNASDSYLKMHTLQ